MCVIQHTTQNRFWSIFWPDFSFIRFIVSLLFVIYRVIIFYLVYCSFLLVHISKVEDNVLMNDLDFSSHCLVDNICVTWKVGWLYRSCW